MGLFTAVSAYSCHVWPCSAKIADNKQSYCWHVYALNVGNMKTWQYCNIFVQDKIHTIFVTICCRMWLYGYSQCKYTTCGYIQGSNNIIKSTKHRVYDKVWLNKNIKAFYHKTWKLGDPTPLRQCVFESCLIIETKIDTPIVL